MQGELLHRIISEKLTVRQLDEEVMKITGKMPEPSDDAADIMPKVENNNVRTAPIIAQNLSHINEEAQKEAESAPNAEITPIEIPENMPQENKKEEKPLNIFDQLRVPSDKTNTIEDLPKPNVESVVVPEPAKQLEQTPVQEQNQINYNNTYDLRFAINNFRQAVQNTEKFGFKVNASEQDLGNKYQIIIDIEK